MNPQNVSWVPLTQHEGNCFFGYYDRFALDPGNTRHLALRIPQQERIPACGEMAEVGYVDVAARRFVTLAQTQAWCPQQGAMLEWLPAQPGCFLYNDFVPGADGGWQAVAKICDANDGRTVRVLPRPSYVLSHNGRWAASLNFARIPRRGYSYARAELANEPAQPDLDRDGLFRMDVATGECRLIAPYRTLIAAHPFPYDLADKRIWLNHAIFNCDDSRVMVLLRHRPQDQPAAMWQTFLLTMDLDGGNLLCPLPEQFWRDGAISHQIWGRSPREILVDADWCGRGHEYVVFNEDRVPMLAHRISAGMGPMAHLVFSPDGQWLAADTYPEHGEQRLALVRVATGEVIEIGRFRHGAVASVEVRCDLHPRWSRDGRFLSVDTIHDGARGIYLADLRALVG